MALLIMRHMLWCSCEDTTIKKFSHTYNVYFILPKSHVGKYNCVYVCVCVCKNN